MNYTRSGNKIINYKNEKTGNTTEVIIYYNLQKITVATKDVMNFYNYNKITDILNHLLLKQTKKNTNKDISNYTIQVLHLV
jgi:hypothetical protein